ncbi:hypothetical protein F5H01DRAFT_325598 [Linnemannia elongata]|nr:hypothetical protein F5H01DRAFT_325598 [Linnemannia elongata]
MHFSFAAYFLLLLGGSARAQIFGKVNGHNCLEPKRSDGCCETWTNQALGQVVECPALPKLTFACLDGFGDCIQWKQPGCGDHYYEIRGLLKRQSGPILGAVCDQVLGAYDPSYYNKEFDNMFQWCKDQGGSARQVNFNDQFCPDKCSLKDIVLGKCRSQPKQ